MPGSRRLLQPALALPLLALAFAGCTAPAHYDVVATFYPLEFLAQRIGGGNVSVGSIVRPGAEPHDYEPTVADLNAISDARLLVVQGAGFEGWILRARQQAPDTKTVTATDGIDLRQNLDAKESAGLPNDPHTWVDPPLYAKMARNVEAAMVQAFPEHAQAFHHRAEALVDDLDGLDQEFRTGLANCTIPHVITGHAAFGYLAAQYHFEQIAIQGLDPEAEPDSRTINHVIDAAKRYGITVVFFEDLVNPAMTEAIAKEAHAETRVLSPLEAIPTAKLAHGADYFTVQRENLQNLREAMHCA